MTVGFSVLEIAMAAVILVLLARIYFLSHDRNKWAVMDALRRNGHMTGRELIDITPVGRGVVYVVLSQLEDNGLIGWEEKDGQPREYFAI